MFGVILAAGDGKRLKDSRQENCCKPLIKINEKSLIEYALDNLTKLGIDNTYVVIGKEGEMIKNVIGDEYKGIKVIYVVQQEQIGLVDAFVQALDVTDCKETAVLQLSDEIFVDLQADSIKGMVEKNEYDFYCGVTPEENPEKIKNNFSVEIDGSLIVKCTEKPKEVHNDIKGTGFSIFCGEAQKLIKEMYKSDSKKLFDLCDCFNVLTEAGNRGYAFTVAEKEFNINTIADLTEAENYLK